MKHTVFAILSLILMGCGGGGGSGESTDLLSQAVKKTYFTPSSETGYYDVLDINSTVIDTQAFTIGTVSDGNNTLYTYDRVDGNESSYSLRFTDSGETFVNELNITGLYMGYCPFYDGSTRLIDDSCMGVSDSNGTHTYVINGKKNIGIDEIHTVEDVNKTYINRTIFYYD